MPHTSRIPTPLKQHLHRFRLGVLPALAFGLCVLLTLWLWNRQGVNGLVVGEVEASLVDVAAGTEGRLVELPTGGYWRPFDRVQRGQPIAYLDDRMVQARIQTVQAEADQLLAELDAEQTKFELDRMNLVQQHQRDFVRLQWEKERRQIEALTLLATIDRLRATLNGMEASLNAMLPPGLARGIDTIDLKQQYDATKTEFESHRRTYREMKIQYDAVVKELEEYPDQRVPEVDTVLEPIRAGIRVQEAAMQEVQIELDNLVITAPIDGVISAIYRYPGQQVMPGDRIVSIARPDSNYVISYVRERQRIKLYEGMEVGLRLRSEPGSPEYTSSVELVGPQVTAVPAHQLNDQAIPEWATPIRIPIPAELKQEALRPGQLVQVIFRSSSQSR